MRAAPKTTPNRQISRYLITSYATQELLFSDSQQWIDESELNGSYSGSKRTVINK